MNDTHNTDDTRNDATPHTPQLRDDMRALLDRALPSADERRGDLERLALVRPKGSFALCALASAGASAVGAFGLYLAVPALGAVVMSGIDQDFADATLRIARTDDASVPALHVDGNVEIFKRVLAANVRGVRLPALLAQRPTRARARGDNGFDLLKQLADDAPGLVIHADPCIRAMHVDFVANRVPMQVSIDALVEALHLKADYSDEDGLRLGCVGQPYGSLQELSVTSLWPLPEDQQSERVHIDAHDIPLDDVVADLGRQLSLPVRYYSTHHPRVTMSLQNVRAQNALEALSDSTGTFVTITTTHDVTELVVVGALDPVFIELRAEDAAERAQQQQNAQQQKH